MCVTVVYLQKELIREVEMGPFKHTVDDGLDIRKVHNLISCVLRLKVKGLDTCDSIAYMSQTQKQQCFTISEVAADWHELMIPQCIMRPSIDRQLDPRFS